MAGTITAIADVIHYPSGTYSSSTKLDQHGFSDVDTIIWYDEQHGALTTNSPTSMPGNSLTGHSVPSFKDDLYDRIHVTPTNFDLGNILALTTQNITVWNAYFSTSVTLNQIIKNVIDDSIDIIEPVPSPVVYTPQQIRTYTLEASEDGPNTSKVTFTFDFDTTDIDVFVTANRIILLYFMPQKNISQTFEWKTTILKSYDMTEKTQKIRNAPREIIDYNYRVEDRFLLSNIIFGSHSLRLVIPRWIQFAELTTAININDTEVYCDVDRLDVNPDDSIFLWKDDDTYEAIKVISVEVDHFVTDPFLNAFSLPTFIYSAAKCVISPIVDFDIYRTNLSSFKIKYKNINQFDVGTNDLPIQLAGYDVLTDARLMQSNTSRFSSNLDVTILDYVSAPFVHKANVSRPNYKFKVAKRLYSYDDIRSFQQWLNKMSGRNGRFYVAGYANQIKPKVDPINGLATTIEIDNINLTRIFTLKIATLYAYLELFDGTYYIKEITSAGVINQTTEDITISSSYGTDIPLSQIKIFDILHFVRMNSDSITFNYETFDQANVSFEVIETR